MCEEDLTIVQKAVWEEVQWGEWKVWDGWGGWLKTLIREFMILPLIKLIYYTFYKPKAINPK